VGKRSRKRSAGAPVAADSGSGRSSRAERDAARARRAQTVARGSPTRPRRRPGRTSPEDRPPAPWGSFPLVELVVLLALVLIVLGAIIRGTRGGTMFVAGLVLGSLAGLELSFREHFGGFRSHSSLLAAFVSGVSLPATYFILPKSQARVLVMVVVAGVVYAGSFWLFRRAFARRSGGVGFRR
jgi:hypothetical protein